MSENGTRKTWSLDPKVKTETRYPDLQGRDLGEARFRPKRHRVSELLGTRAMYAVTGGQRYTIRDISMNGIAVDIGSGQPMWPEGSEIAVSVQLYGAKVHEGRARVVRVESRRGGHRMGLGLLEGFLDIPGLFRAHKERQLTRAFVQTPTERWRLLPPAYREAVAHASYFMGRYHKVLGEHEARYRDMGRDGQRRIEELTVRAYDAMRGPWNEIRAEAAEGALELMHPSEQKLRYVAKEHTETVLTPLLLDGPVIQRSYAKPLDYAGDFKTMGYIYRNDFEGDSIFGRVVHKLAVEEPLAAGVRTRKELIKRLHCEEASRHRDRSPGEPHRITSLGSGLALEVTELVSEKRPWVDDAMWTMVDIEENALSLAYADVHTAIRENNSRAALNCFHTSFKQFLAAPMGAADERAQQFIYASGLFDYIPRAAAPVVVRALFDRLAPGGLLSIGNALWPNKHFWFGEFVLDWSLIYRTQEQILPFTSMLGDEATCTVESEDSGAYFFLNIRKKDRA